MSLEGKKVFVTGGTGGIGKPLVAQLQAAGAIVSVYDRNKEGDIALCLDDLCHRLRNDTPDILINMAGYNVFDYCENQNLEAIHYVNLIVPMRLCQAVLPTMKQRNSGQIVNIGSMTALIPLPHGTGYASAKAGLKAFSDSLRRELGSSKISVTHVVPRAVRTAMNSGKKALINEKTNANYDDPKKVASLICQAIISRKKEVRIGWPERVYALLNALIPSVIDKALQKNRQAGEEILGPSNEANNAIPPKSAQAPQTAQ